MPGVACADDTRRDDVTILSETGVPATGALRRDLVRVVALLPLFQVLLLGGAVAFLYSRVFADLAAQWWADENYSHGFVVPLISAYLVWERRDALVRCPLRGSTWGYGLVVLALALLILGQAATFGYAVRISVILVLAGLTLYLAGGRALRILTFPFGYLLFMIPLPAPVLTKIAFPLQLLAARVATSALDLFNIPVLREGNIIDLSVGRLDVTEACSGIRSLISLIALAVIFAYFTQQTWRGRILLVLSAIPIAVAANAARVALTGVLAQTFGIGAAMGFYHLFSGWLVFVVAFALLIGTGWIVTRVEAATAGARA
jgi:exosortase